MKARLSQVMTIMLARGQDGPDRLVQRRPPLWPRHLGRERYTASGSRVRSPRAAERRAARPPGHAEPPVLQTTSTTATPNGVRISAGRSRHRAVGGTKTTAASIPSRSGEARQVHRGDRSLRRHLRGQCPALQRRRGGPLVLLRWSAEDERRDARAARTRPRYGPRYSVVV